jgi:hypothetical protein
MTVHQINIYRFFLTVALGVSVSLAIGCAKKDSAGNTDHKNSIPKTDDHSGHDHSKHDAAEPNNQVAATQTQITAYPTDMCVISDEKLGDHGKVIEHMHNGQLVRLCCKACIKSFNKDPAKYIAKIDASKKAGAK